MELPIPVVPVEEQQRIVEEVEKELTRLDAAVGSLWKVQANLKRYRAAVLKAACEGRLVPTGAELARAEHSAAQDLPTLSAGWTWTTLGSHIDRIEEATSARRDGRRESERRNLEQLRGGREQDLR